VTDQEAFEAHRELLFAVAYQMLGTVADAEDTVQDAWLRWSAAPRSDVSQPRAYLVKTVTHIALNRLQSAGYRGPGGTGRVGVAGHAGGAGVADARRARGLRFA
jgi:DNA-directed RNA polymerase specialized sigma24 family protein